MSQTIIIALFGTAFLAINAFLLWFFLRNKKDEKEESVGLNLLLEQMNELSRTVDSKLGESTKIMQSAVTTQFTESQKLIKEITRELTEVKETGKQVVSFADQLQSLQDILKNPKQRGVLGEYYLETLLKNVLAPGQYQMQYAFEDGSIVDAIVKVKEKIVPIDSKFSLENYNRMVEEKDEVERKKLEKIFENDLKQRIIETSKYVRPQEGTMEFAFMFIPHEAIYYDLLVGRVGQDENENLIQRAALKYKVIIVSPTSFLAYLQTVLQALKALHIEEKVKDIIIWVGNLNRHLETYNQHFNAVGNTLGTTVNHYNKASKEFKKIDKDVLKITGESSGVEILELDRPDRGGE